MRNSTGAVLAKAAAAVLLLAALSVQPAPGPARAAGRDPRGPHELYFAEGTTRDGYREFICLGNPAGSAISVTLEYMPEAGDPVTSTIEIPALSRATVDVNAALGPGRDVSAPADRRLPGVNREGKDAPGL